MAKVSVRGAPPRVGKTAQPVHPLMEARERIVEAERLRQARDLDRAQGLCEAIIERHPDYVGALHTLGLVFADKRDYRQALSYLIQAVMLNSKDWKTLTALSGVYLRLDAGVMAARTLEQAAQLKPEDAGILATLGEIYRDQDEYEAAAEAFRRASSIDKSLQAATLGLGLSCTQLGQLAEAAAAFEELVEHGSRSIRLLYSLSQLPARLVSADVLSLLDEVVPDAREDKEDFDSSLAFTRAAALDKAGRHAEAWESLVAANRQPFLQNRDDYRKLLEMQEIFLDGARKCAVMPESRESRHDGHPLSLFILGPSRSGKTTTELLVSVLDGVKRGYENPIVENSVRRAFQTAGLPTRNRIVELPPSMDQLCRDFYLEELGERAGSAKVFTNTLPGQIQGVLRIAAVLPNVRFIFVKRDPDDIGLRIYMRTYKSGNTYAYDIGNIRAHIAWYYQMVDVVAERLPHISTVIQYENMIADPATALESIAELCGLAPPDAPLPRLGDDRECAAPYRELMAAASKG